jgi:hypothetical protein
MLLTMIRPISFTSDLMIKNRISLTGGSLKTSSSISVKMTGLWVSKSLMHQDIPPLEKLLPIKSEVRKEESLQG